MFCERARALFSTESDLVFREENFPRDEVTGGNFWIKCLSRSSVLVERIRPFPRLKTTPAFFSVKMAPHSLNSPRKTRIERERSARFCFCFARRKSSAQERERNIRLDWIGLDWIGKIFGPLSPLWLIWKTPPSFLRRRRRRKKKRTKH